MVLSMSFGSEVPWERYGLIAEIAERFHAGNHRLGKTVLQKVIFLLQRSFKVDCDYGYTLYTYGPYSADVARDLDIVTGLGGAKVDYDFSFAGYEIYPGPASTDLRKRAEAYLRDISPMLDQLVADFGGMSAKDLELRSTAVYLSKPGLERAKLMEQVHEVKPHFTPAQIEVAVRELEEKGYVGDHRAMQVRP